jgi:hypothetical protein
MPSQTRESSADLGTRTCPECCDTLVFSSRYPVLRIQPGRDRPDERAIHYETAWVCRNGCCDYRELLPHG